MINDFSQPAKMTSLIATPSCMQWGYLYDKPQEKFFCGNSVCTKIYEEKVHHYQLGVVLYTLT